MFLDSQTLPGEVEWISQGEMEELNRQGREERKLINGLMHEASQGS